MSAQPDAEVVRRRFTVAEYEQMVATGVPGPQR
jgi:hypothetical protein